MASPIRIITEGYNVTIKGGTSSQRERMALMYRGRLGTKSYTVHRNKVTMFNHKQKELDNATR